MKAEYIGKTLLLTLDDKRRVLVIGDLHLGYEEALNETGVLVSRGLFEEVLSYLDKVFEKIGDVNEVVLLGDVKHVFGGVLKQERGDVIRLINYLLEKAKKLIIIKGNHDSILEPILVGKERVELLESYSVNDVCFIHGDKDNISIWAKGIKLVVAGHVHPAVRLNDGVKSERYKCFLKGKIKNDVEKAENRELIIVPSFSEYNEGIDLLQNEIELPWKVNLEKFEVIIVKDNELDALNFGKLGKLRK